MGKIQFVKTMSLKEADDLFRKEFGLTLTIFNDDTVADENSTLHSLSKVEGLETEECFNVDGNMTVVDFETAFENHFGVKIKVMNNLKTEHYDDNILLKNLRYTNVPKVTPESIADFLGIRDEYDKLKKDEEGNK